jgi:hypothetical protein
MNEVVGQAKAAYENIVPTPSAVASVCDTVGVAVDAMPSVNDTLTTWEPLLEKVELFTEIVDKIAEVNYNTTPCPILLTYILGLNSGSSLCEDDVDSAIRSTQGMLPRYSINS